MKESVQENKEEKDILILSHGAVLLTLLALQKDVAFKVMTSVIEIENAKAIEFDCDGFRCEGIFSFGSTANAIFPPY